MEVQSPEKPHQRIRKEMLDSLLNDTVRAIVGSQFSATPHFEEKYYEHIRNRKEYFDMYSRWVLSQSPLPPLPADEEFFILQDDILGTQNGETATTINYPLLYFFFDMLSPFLNRLVDLGLSYYRLGNNENENDESAKAVTVAIVRSLTLCRKEDVEREGYDSFLTMFLDLFKIFFASEIEAQPIKFPSDNAAFAAAFESEWQRLYRYSDSLYGFEVVPLFSPQDIFRYLQLPFSSSNVGKLLKKKEYREAMNYVAAVATFKPVPDSRVRVYFRQELCKLFTPLVSKCTKETLKWMKVKPDRAEAEIREALSKKLSEVTASFDFFYATTKNLQRGKISPFANFFLPLRGRLAMLGHIFENNEYPYTAYIYRKLKAEVAVYVSSDQSSRDENSLDAPLNRDEDVTLRDVLTEGDGYGACHIPGYDAINGNKERIGWTIRTFAGIANMGISTLRRWDRQGLLKPKRYVIASPRYGTMVRYRAYTREDLNRTKGISDRLERVMRHEE